MKRFTLLITIWIVSSVPVLAQSGLHINSLFDGRFKKDPYATELIVTGAGARDINLKVYHSLKVMQKSQQNLIESLVVKDGVKANDKEVEYRSGQLYYGFYTMPASKSGLNRYIFYLNQNLAHNNPKNMVTLIYMEGKATPEQIKKLIRK